MPHNEHLHQSSETVQAFGHEEDVQYRDGEISLLYRTPGDFIILGQDSGHKYAKSFHRGGIDIALVHTKSGNTYGIGEGVIANSHRGMAHVLPSSLPPIELGKPWIVPGVMQTTPVDAVQLRYKVGDEGYSELQIDDDSPWDQLRDRLRESGDKLGLQ